jgi:hypothetical protein
MRLLFEHQDQIDQEASMAQMPFSPCDTSGGACTDRSVSMLRDIFGPVIDALVSGVDPNTVAASANVIATLMSFFNSGILVIGSLIVSYVAVMGITNTANDGEAMGKSWSSLWTPVRIVAGGAVLLPTASGYSFIQLVVLLRNAPEFEQKREPALVIVGRMEVHRP